MFHGAHIWHAANNTAFRRANFTKNSYFPSTVFPLFPLFFLITYSHTFSPKLTTILQKTPTHTAKPRLHISLLFSLKLLEKSQRPKPQIATPPSLFPLIKLLQRSSSASCPIAQNQHSPFKSSHALSLLRFPEFSPHNSCPSTHLSSVAHPSLFLPLFPSLWVPKLPRSARNFFLPGHPHFDEVIWCRVCVWLCIFFPS